MNRFVSLRSVSTGTIIVMILCLLVLPLVHAGEKIPVPPGDDRFAGVKLNILADEFAVALASWYGDELKKECGVEIGNVQPFPSRKDMETIMPKLIAGKRPPWDLIICCALYAPDFLQTGAFEPLDTYLEKYEGTDAYLEDIVPAYREFYVKFDGRIYALPMDGDVHVLHYRPSYFNNEEYKKKFREEYGYPLEVPQTWTQYIDVAKFFTENTPDDIYGTQLGGGRPFSFAWFFNIAAAMGVKYFDEDMNPLINTPKAVKALEMLIEMAKYSPPGVENYTGSQEISNWQQGKVIMHVWWVDMREFTAQAKVPIVGDTADTVMPGILLPNGDIVRRATMPYSRVALVPKGIPEKRKEAAFYVAYRLSHSDYSIYSAADPYCGLDPYLKSHFSERAIAQYTKPNPLRGTTPEYPENEGIFSTIREAREHLEADKANLAVGFPQPVWPGAPEYCDTLSMYISKALAGEMSAKEALDAAAEEWTKIVEKKGRESQKKYYADFVKAAKKLGYW